MTDDEQIREITSRIFRCEQAIERYGEAGILLAKNHDLMAEWLKTLSERVASLEKGYVKLS